MKKKYLVLIAVFSLVLSGCNENKEKYVSFENMHIENKYLKGKLNFLGKVDKVMYYRHKIEGSLSSNSLENSCHEIKVIFDSGYSGIYKKLKEHKLEITLNYPISSLKKVDKIRVTIEYFIVNEINEFEKVEKGNIIYSKWLKIK